MKTRVGSTLKTGALALSLLATITSCGQKDDPGRDLAIEVRPDSNVLIGPGPDSSCGDLMEQKFTGGAASRSVSGPVIRFPRFLLDWQSSETLYVSGVRVTIQGAGILNGEFFVDLDSTEIEALLGYEGGIVPGKTQIDSTSAAVRGTGSPYAPCGLVVGGISLTNGTDKTSSFKARVQIELIGASEDDENNLHFVRQTFLATADFRARK